MDKSPDAFRTITEVAEWLDTPAHVLRFWESRFPQIKPVKRAGGRRYYRPVDMLLLGGIKKLLHDDGITIKGVQNLLREQGIKHVQSLSLPVGLTVTIRKKSNETRDTTVQQAAPPPEPTVEPIAQKPVKQPIVTVLVKPKETAAEQLVLNDPVDTDTADEQELLEPMHMSSVDEASMVIANFPDKLKSASEISRKDMQDIEAFYYSLKMVRNNMRRTGAGR